MDADSLQLMFPRVDQCSGFGIGQHNWGAIGSKKSDRVVKLAAGGKVLVGEEEGTLADLKAGDKVTVTLASDESAAVLIQSGGKKPAGDKPKPEKEEGE